MATETHAQSHKHDEGSPRTHRASGPRSEPRTQHSKEPEPDPPRHKPEGTRQTEVTQAEGIHGASGPRRKTELRSPKPEPDHETDFDAKTEAPEAPPLHAPVAAAARVG